MLVLAPRPPPALMMMMTMTPPVSTVVRCAASAPYLRLCPCSPSSVSVAPMPRRQRWRGRIRSLPPEGVPSELMEEDSKFVPLNADDPMYGPPGETDKILAFLKELEGEFLKVIHCTEEITKKTLWDAMHTEQPNLEAAKIAESMPRICIFSGLTGEEMMMFINAFPEAGLEPAAFAALVPNSAEKILDEVIEEIMGDHEMLTGKNSV